MRCLDVIFRNLRHEGMLTVINQGAYSLPERETGESSGATGEKSKTQSKSDDISK